MRQGILGRDTVQLRLQRITEVNIRQELIERLLGTGSLVIDVQGEDDSLTLEYMRKPAVVQRVIDSQINEIVGVAAVSPSRTTCCPPRARARRGACEDHYDVEGGTVARGARHAPLRHERAGTTQQGRGPPTLHQAGRATGALPLRDTRPVD